ncbi:MAG: DUF2279 domain-containing protein [Bacteroidota bacterium]
MLISTINRVVLLLVVVIIVTTSLVAQPDSIQSNSMNNKSLYNLRELQYTYQMDSFDPFQKDINYPILAGVGLTYGFIIYQINEYYNNTWWKSDSNYYSDGSFHIVNDWEYALGIDKIGHMYGAAVMSHFFAAGLEAGNVNPELSIWLGAVGGLSLQMYTEIKDGFAPISKATGEPKWGFSPGDAIANFLGAGYFVAQHYYPYLYNFQLRASYYPSEAMRNGEKPDNNISDDYDGQKLWLAFRMKNLLPKSIAEHWPSFLMLSAGYAVSGVGHNANDEGIIPSYYLALDFDAEVIPLHGEFWDFIKNTLNYIHFPMPGIKFSKDGLSFLLIAY